MSGEIQENEHAVDRLYADAVCAQCNTVNPEGTLICRTCGNNLRDQRSIRLSADQVLEGEGEGIERRRFFLGALTVFGILLILWTTINVNRITDWLIAIQTPSMGSAEDFWDGPGQAVFDEMAGRLEDSAPTADELRAALEEPIAGSGPDGVYALAVAAGQFGFRPVGMAVVQRQGEDYYFVAQVRNATEVRGVAQLQGNAYSVTWERAGARADGEYAAVSGVALQQPDGTYECFGRSESADQGYEFVACFAQGL